MKNSRKKRMLTGLSGVCLCLLCGGAPAEGTGGASAPAENTAPGTPADTTATNPGNEDLLDRAFSPLDKAVSDVNHDINEGTDNEPSETGASQPQKNTGTGASTGTAVTKPQHEDVLDRAFSPLDKAVSDINRDINEGDDEKAPETNQ